MSPTRYYELLSLIANVYLGVTNMDDGNVAVTDEAVKRTLAISQPSSTTAS